MKRIGMILNFEYMGYMKNKAFRVTTVILLAIILLASVFPQILGVLQGVSDGDENGDEKGTALVVGSFADTEALTQIAPDYEWTKGDASEDPRKAAETYDVVLSYDGGATYTLYGAGHDFSLYGLVEMLDGYFTETGRAAFMQDLDADARTGAEQTLGIVVSGGIETVGGGDADSNFWLSYILLYLLFMIMVMYGQFVISSVINEKSTKAMEILITSAKPIQLMFGKVAGVGCAALTQLLLILVAAAAGLLLNFDSWKARLPEVADSISEMNLSPALVLFFLLFFVCGYLLYAFIYAGLGSTVSKIEDAGAVTTLPQVFVLIAFFVSMVGMANLDAVYVKVLSYIPFFSPFIMFARISMGEAGYLQGVVALLILAPTIILFSWIAAKIYRIGVMMYGKPMKLREIVKVVAQR
ncbi:MAG: ABC transporter permease [Clostridiales Family XIII bacterium]|jgi:ABC-2 type transport system permease protein|nr:ABC transporter permease [Clostridiales Family XIII bacterium]